MPEENKEKTLEEPKAKETKEETKKVEPEVTEEEGEKQISKPEEGEEEKEVPEKEPPKRFPKQEQSPLEKRIGYIERKLKEKEEAKVEDLNLGEDEEEKPVTRRELNQLLEQQKKELLTNQMTDQFLDENPDFKKYGKVIRKYASDSDYANIPIGSIASMIVGEHLDEEANERAKIKIEADQEAAKTKIGGSSKRGFPSTKKVWDMTPKEFEEYQVEILKKGRD